MDGYFIVKGFLYILIMLFLIFTLDDNIYKDFLIKNYYEIKKIHIHLIIYNLLKIIIMIIITMAIFIKY